MLLRSSAKAREHEEIPNLQHDGRQAVSHHDPQPLGPLRRESFNCSHKALSPNNVLDDLTIDIGKSEVATTVAIG